MITDSVPSYLFLVYSCIGNPFATKRKNGSLRIYLSRNMLYVLTYSHGFNLKPLVLSMNSMYD